MGRMNYRIFSRLSSITPVFAASLLLGILSLIGCGSSDAPSPDEPKEIVTPATSTVEGPEEQLFADGKRLYEAGYYLIAKETFTALRDSYPLGPYREFAEIKVADCAFFLNDFEEAATTYESIVKSRPGSPSAPYLLLQSGRSFQSMNTDLGRDKQPLEKAVELYTKLIERFPESSAALSAKQLRQEARHQIALHEKMIADFYKKQGAMAAYEARMKEYEKELAEYDASLIAPVEIVAAQKLSSDTAIREHSDSPKVFSVARLNPDMQTTTDISGSQSSEESPVALPASLREVECSKKGHQRITVYLQNEGTAESIKAALVPNSNGMVTLSLPVSFGEKPAQIDCFGKRDLTLQQSELTIATEHSARVVSLSRPPRLTIFLE